MAARQLLLSLMALTTLMGAAASGGGQPGGFAYVVNGSGGNLSAYRIDGTTGALEQIAGSPFPAGIFAYEVTVDPTGRFVLVSDWGGYSWYPPVPGGILAYAIDPSSGALTPVPGSPIRAQPGELPTSVAVDPTGRFAYLANNSSNNVSAYAIDATTGALEEIAGSPFPAGAHAFSVTVEPTGQFAYVANQGNRPDPPEGTISAYAIDGTTGALEEIAGSPFPAHVYPGSVVVEPGGRFAYVANSGSQNVSVYAIDATTGALEEIAGSPFPAGVFPISVALDPPGRFAYVANFGSNNVSAYEIDSTTGALAPVAGSPFAAGAYPGSVTVHHSGQFAYVSNRGHPGNVSAYAIDETTGALTPISGSPFPAGWTAFWIATTPGPQL